MVNRETGELKSGDGAIPPAAIPPATGPVAVSARYDKRVHRVVIGLSTGIDVAFPPHKAQGLETARAADLDIIQISPSGLGLHFPKLDADLYLPGILEGTLGSPGWIAGRCRQRVEGARDGSETPVPRTLECLMGGARAMRAT